jgi:hypothetical protein
MEQLACHWSEIREILHLIIFRKICRENSSFIKIRQEHQVLRMPTYGHL